jgi:hypothetical protein
MTKTVPEVVASVEDILDEFGEECGCIAIYTNGYCTTFKWGKCSEGCTKFNGCMRSTIDRSTEEEQHQYM